MGRLALCLMTGVFAGCAHGAAQTAAALAAYVQPGEADEALDRLVVIDDLGRPLATMERPRPRAAVTPSFPAVVPTTGQLLWVADAVVSAVDWRAGALETVATLPGISPDPQCDDESADPCPIRPAGEPPPALVTGARVTDDGAHLCVQVEQGDPVYTNAADEFEYDGWHLVVDLASGQVTRQACPSPPLFSFDMQRPVDDPRATLPTVELVQGEGRCGVLLGDHFLALELAWGEGSGGCQLTLQAPFGSGRYLPVYAFMGMTDGLETYSALYLVDLTTRTLVTLPPPDTEEREEDWDPRAVSIVQHIGLAQDRADGLPWRRSRSIDVFYTADGLGNAALIDLRATPPMRRPVPYLGWWELVFLR